MTDAGHRVARGRSLLPSWLIWPADRTLERELGAARSQPVLAADRLYAFLLALLFCFVVRFVYRDIILASGVYDYMGIRWNSQSLAYSWFCLLFAALPALWLPLTIRRPSDIVSMLLHGMVFIPTAVMMPHLSAAPIPAQIGFLAASMLGLTMVGMAGRLPLFRFVQFGLPNRTFLLLFGILYVALWLILIFGGGIALTSLSLVEVYGDRLKFMERMGNLSPVFLYASSACMTAFGPFLVAYGMVRRSPVAVGLGALLLFGTFAATTHKVAYLGLFGVIGIWALLALKPNRPYLAIVGGFAAAVIAGIVVDLIAFGGMPPKLSWFFFFRIFGNSGFLSAGYLDYFFNSDKIYYTQSFMRHFMPPIYTKDVQRIIGEYWTHNPVNHANANLWADAYANLSYPGILLMSAALTVILWMYNHLAQNKSLALTALMLVMPTVALSNGGVHSSILSGGVFYTLLLALVLPFSTPGHVAPLQAYLRAKIGRNRAPAA